MSSIVTSVPRNTSSVLLFAANSGRTAGTIYNDDAQPLYVLLANGTASPSNYTVRIPTSGYYELPMNGSGVYIGPISGVWPGVGSGAAQVTEMM